MYCNTCESNPCTCRTTRAIQAWVLRDCGTPGCFTMVRESIGNQTQVPVCRWCQRGMSHATLGKPAVDIRLRHV